MLKIRTQLVDLYNIYWSNLVSFVICISNKKIVNLIIINQSYCLIIGVQLHLTKSENENYLFMILWILLYIRRGRAQKYGSERDIVSAKCFTMYVQRWFSNGTLKDVAIDKRLYVLRPLPIRFWPTLQLWPDRLVWVCFKFAFSCLAVIFFSVVFSLSRVLRHRWGWVGMVPLRVLNLSPH